MGTLPSFSDVIDLRWFIEPLRGADNPGNFLDRFPEEVYNKAPDSHLVRFMYTFLGPSGIGWLKQNLLDARIIMEDHGLELFDLEKFYGNPLAFGRLIEELYDEDPTGVLPRADWDRIRARDESYRSRAINFINAARLGTSPEGMRLAGQSGLGHDVEIVENYKYLFDVHSDNPMGLDYLGSTASTEEFIIVPRRESSRTEVQTISLETPADSGNFVLVFDGHGTTDYDYAPRTHTVANQTVGGTFVTTVDSTVGFVSAGAFTFEGNTVAYTGKTGNTFTGCTGFAGTIYANTPIQSPVLTFDSIPWNAPAFQVEAALHSLPGITSNAVTVSDGPFPNPYTVTFTGFLSNQDVSEISAITGIMDSTDSNAIRAITVTTTTGGIESVDEVVTIAPQDHHHLQEALDRLRPVASIPTVYNGRGTRARQPWTAALASSEYSEVVRYVTGSSAITWPELDTVHWIESVKEVEAPRVKDDRQHHYTGFHNVTGIVAYTDEALTNLSYDNDESVLAQYNTVHVGSFPDIRDTIPFFGDFTDPALVFSADRALADYAEPLVVTTQDNATGFQFINGIYPIDYASLPGVPEVKYKDEQFWSSRERISGADYLEIDLGSPQAVNFITFETISKPMGIEIAFDTLDQKPRRNFVAVTPSDRNTFPVALKFDPTSLNPWSYLEFDFTDSQGQMVFTRYIRIGITRRTDDSTFRPGFLYDSKRNVQNPWSVEVKNLRIGRHAN